ncbi:MAG: Gfo/Idh/MocA family oxidoreductase [Chloroflexi bacterium]|nr:Gfo/Idh/MocA family oxidoreductase [Chloroflexota bacterium]
MKNFALTGVAGYVAPRHLKAIRDTGNAVVAALDPNDSVGILDSYAFDIKYFTEFERFDRHLEKLRRGPAEKHVHILSVCSPNYLHDAHCRLALRIGADVICEKPLVINPWNLDQLHEIEQETGRRVYTVLQLRVHPKLIALREKIQRDQSAHQYDVVLTYVTMRGGWYHVSWKGSEEKSGGIATNIGIHFFDLLLWLFGPVAALRVYHIDQRRAAGFLEMERARVRWFLSVDGADLPFAPEPGVRTTHRSIAVDGEEVEFTSGFSDLHTRVYERTLAGDGFGIDAARPSITLVRQIRNAPVVAHDTLTHEFLKR